MVDFNLAGCGAEFKRTMCRSRTPKCCLLRCFLLSFLLACLAFLLACLAFLLACLHALIPADPMPTNGWDTVPRFVCVTVRLTIMLLPNSLMPAIESSLRRFIQYYPSSFNCWLEPNLIFLLCPFSFFFFAPFDMSSIQRTWFGALLVVKCRCFAAYCPDYHFLLWVTHFFCVFFACCIVIIVCVSIGL